MANKYAVASGLWSSTATWSDTDGGAPGATVPADTDTVFILINVAVQVDVDQSAFATGMGQLTIRGHATTPAMLYFKNGTNGYLKFGSSANIIGTSGTVRGRLLANSDGVWTTSTPLQASNTAFLDFRGTGSGLINCQFLDVRLYCSHPTLLALRTYGSKWVVTAGAGTVNVATNQIDLGSTPPTAGTAIRFAAAAGGTLPFPLLEDTQYFVRAVSVNLITVTCVSGFDDGIMDLTTVGSGTFTVYTGHTNTSTAVINVLDDPTTDTYWTTTANRNTVVLINENNGADPQKLTLSAIAAGTVTLSANVSSAKSPGSRLWLASRNITLKSVATTSSQNTVDCGSATIPQILNCEIAGSFSAPNGTTAAIRAGSGHTFTGTCWGLGQVFITGGSVTVPTVLAVQILACGSVLSQIVNTEMTGTIAGCNSVLSSVNAITLTGPVVGCGNVVNICHDINLNGEFRGCAQIAGGAIGVVFGPNSFVRMCSTVVTGCTSVLMKGFCINYTTGVTASVGVLITGGLGFAPDGTRYRASFDFGFPSQGNSGGLHVICRGALTDRRPYLPPFSGRSSTVCGTINQVVRTGVFLENANRILGSQLTILPTADIWKRKAGGDWLIGTRDINLNSNGTMFNVRNTIAPGRVPFGGTKVRVLFAAMSTNPVPIVGASIGLMTTSNIFDATPTRLTFNGGSSSATIPSAKYLYSDEVVMAFNPALRYGIHYATDGTQQTPLATSNLDGYYLTNSGDHTLTLAPTINSSNGTGIGCVIAIEVFSDLARTAGVDYLDAFPLSFMDLTKPAQLLDLTEINVPASAQTRTLYMRGLGWTVFPTAAQLYLEAEYISNATTLQPSVVASTAVLPNNTDWTAFPVSFTPAAVAHVRYRAWLKLYQINARVLLEGQLSA